MSTNNTCKDSDNKLEIIISLNHLEGIRNRILTKKTQISREQAFVIKFSVIKAQNVKQVVKI